MLITSSTSLQYQMDLFRSAKKNMGSVAYNLLSASFLDGQNVHNPNTNSKSVIFKKIRLDILPKKISFKKKKTSNKSAFQLLEKLYP